MSLDFPAAHSMDTSWFGVDEEGFVAAFHSFEAGAVPEAFDRNDGYYEVIEALAEQGSVSHVLLDHKGRLMPFDQSVRHETLAHWFDNTQRAARLFVTSLAPLEGDILAGRAFPADAASCQAVIVRGVHRRVLRRVHAMGLCLGCESWYGEDYEATCLGFFEYEHLTDNWISGPYGRATLPTNPRHVSELPEAMRAVVESVRFEGLIFSETPHIQPVDHHPSVSWQSRYMTLDGQELPMPDDS